MPRQSRKRSISGIYHVMMRGINRQSIFAEEGDKQRLLQIIKKYKAICDFLLFGYCFMDNHIHLLIKEGREPFSTTIKRISSSYVFWYNHKYDRCGHLFQERYKSEVVESDAYFLTVLRYIHQNPVKAGMVEKIQQYQWSSYHDYLMEQPKTADTKMALDMLSIDQSKAIELYNNFMWMYAEDFCMEDEEKLGVSDSYVKGHIALEETTRGAQLSRLQKNERNQIIQKLKSIKGVSIRQLARVTGISKSVIDRL